MKYESQILTIFDKLNLKPYPGQTKIINDILTEFYDNKKRNVILSADTGVGKSIIGAVVAMCVSEIEDEHLASFILMSNNALVEQYGRTFDRYSDSQFFQIKGASNYPCDALRKFTHNKYANGESCVIKQVSQAVKDSICVDCEYALAKKNINKTSNLITNYSYYFVSKLWSKHLADRCLTIFDEAHTLNDIFSSHCAIHVSVDRLDKYIEEVKTHIGYYGTGIVDIFEKLKASIIAQRVTDSTYHSFVGYLQEAYLACLDAFAQKAKTSNELEDIDKFTGISKKYFGLSCKISDFKNYDYDHVFEYVEDKNEINIKPIFVGSMSSVILGKKNLFMSATISQAYMEQTLCIDPEETAFIKAPTVFPKEAKTISFLNTQNLNYHSMKQPQVVENLLNTIETIVKDHMSERGENGIILTPSFAISDLIFERISHMGNVLLHTRGSKAADLLKKFKKSKSTVLISPSIYEGIDLPGDESRFQIIVKAPYPSLGDKRMMKIAQNYGDVYRMITLMKIIQGIGRSVRSSDDWAKCYILDEKAEILFDSELNVWRDQFDVV